MKRGCMSIVFARAQSFTTAGFQGCSRTGLREQLAACQAAGDRLDVTSTDANVFLENSVISARSQWMIF